MKNYNVCGGKQKGATTQLVQCGQQQEVAVKNKKEKQTICLCRGEQNESNNEPVHCVGKWHPSGR